MPSALPSVFTGAKIAVAVSVIGAVFAEYTGSNSGLGLRDPGLPAAVARRAHVAAVVVLSLFAIALFALLALAERVALPWAYGPRGERPHEARDRQIPRASSGRAAGLAAAGCGEKYETVTGSARRTQQLTLMLDWFPNADHVGIYQALAEGDFTKAGLDVHVRCHPTRPTRSSCWPPARSTSRSPTSPRSCWRATRACRWCRSRRSCSGRSRRSCRSAQSTSRAGAAARQARRRRRDPLSARLSRHDPGPGRRARELGQGDQRRQQPGPGDAVGPRRRHARRILELRGDPARRSSTSTRT